MKHFRSIDQTLGFMFVFIAVFLAVMLLVFTLVSYTYQMQKTSHEEARNLNRKSESIMSINLDMLYSSFIFDFGTEEFSAELWNMVHDDASYGQTRYAFQNELNSFSQHNSFLISAVVYDPAKKICYSLYKERVLPDAEEILSDEDLQSIKGITWLPSRVTPFVSQDPVIYLVFPIKSGRIASFSEIPNAADAYIIAFINDALLEDFLTLTDFQGNAHTLFLFTENGRMIKGIGKDRNDERIINKIKSVLTYPVYEDFTSIITIGTIQNKMIHVVVYTDKEEVFASLLSAMAVIYMGILLFIAILMLGARRFLRKNISRPLKEVMYGVERIKDGDYEYRLKIYENDEIGELAERINQMSIRITEQMGSIREKEEQQYKTELKLLSEQLNPHFIYNTLEYIRQSILSHSDKGADMMIWHLSRYLRATLAQGRDLVPISSEIKHISSYVKIMESRFASPINLIIDGKLGMENCLVLKTMLQPIVENAIKHGFNIDSNGLVVYNPTIEIRFFREDNKIILEISDSGRGFNVEKVNAIMRSKTEVGKHIGLAHTYSRIQNFYGMGNADIELSSIPYYRNVFKIIVPYSGQDE
ncbi:histidine kinase [uncultured Sphaerochaeta sp.]|uniref:sensor histidine kinase n=1 Tax=uncultured Sphaerochaeta sp. TaxID=886478 RepID=UPI002A0A2353|nr:histidine kinase [uncultured Sphaerochaeta sp.]